MNPATFTPSVQQFGSDETVRWSCCKGEFVLWVATDSFLTSDRSSAWTIRDFWNMRDGDFVTITNRWVDLPVWFELHPTEVADGAALEMMKRLNAGYQPKGPLDGPSIWRVKAGDRLVWVSTRNTSHPVLEVLDLRSCVVALDENSTSSSETLLDFGVPRDNELPGAAAAAMKAGFNAATALGTPRVFAPEWRFGA